MFIVDPQGSCIYNGAIDDKSSADPADIPGAKNYVSQALTEALSGKPVSQPMTTPMAAQQKILGSKPVVTALPPRGERHDKRAPRSAAEILRG